MVKTRKGKQRHHRYALPRGFTLTNEERSWFTDKVLTRYYEIAEHPNVTPSYRFSNRGWAMYNATDQPVSVFLKFIYSKLGATRATEKQFPRWFNTSTKKSRAVKHAARRKPLKTRNEVITMSEQTVNKNTNSTETELMQRLLQRLSANVDDAQLRKEIFEKVDGKKLNDLVEAATYAENAKAVYLKKSGRISTILMGCSIAGTAVAVGMAGLAIYDRYFKQDGELENTGDE